MTDGTSDATESELALWSCKALEYHGTVFIKPAGRGIELLDLESNSQLVPYLVKFGEPLRIEDLMRDGRYRMSLVLKRIEPDEQGAVITSDAG
jgi:hypothetical protein